jgi:hypothetical protein
MSKGRWHSLTGAASVVKVLTQAAKDLLGGYFISEAGSGGRGGEAGGRDQGATRGVGDLRREGRPSTNMTRMHE